MIDSRQLVAGALSLALIGLGCGSSDDEPSGSSGGSGQGGATAGASGGAGGTGAGTGGSTVTGNAGGGAGGAGGSGGASAGSGGSAGAAPVTVQCGTATCMPDPALGRLSRACCVDEATSTCGTMLAGLGMSECTAPVDPDPRCESLMVRSFMLPSCCTADNRCGFTSAMFGFPDCTSYEEAMMIAAGDGGVAPDGGVGFFNITLPQPKACE